MLKSQISSATLVGATLAGVVVLMVLQGPFTWLASIGALILLLILLSYDQDGYRSLFQSIAFSAVCGFCCALASGAVFQLMASAWRGSPEQWSVVNRMAAADMRFRGCYFFRHRSCSNERARTTRDARGAACKDASAGIHSAQRSSGRLCSRTRFSAACANAGSGDTRTGRSAGATSRARRAAGSDGKCPYPFPT